MSVKKQRLSIIERILRTEVIRSQIDLQKSLMDKGFDVTQATLSRDVKYLKIVKTLDDEGHYRYALPTMSKSDSRMPTLLPDVLSLEFSGTLAVIKTRPGYAMGIATHIDDHALDEVLATLAGDDTILVIPRDGFTRIQIKEAILKIVK